MVFLPHSGLLEQAARWYLQTVDFKRNNCVVRITTILNVLETRYTASHMIATNCSLKRIRTN
jgi:hypothetical protein